MKKNKFLTLYFLTIFIAILALTPNYVFLKNTFENSNYNKIAKWQIQNNAIYGTALNQNTFLYKLALVENIKPDIVVVGSSRVMKFRKEFFNSSFINTGGATNDLYEGLKFVKSLLKTHIPKMVILGIDFRWFNKNIEFGQQYPYHKNTGDILTFSKLVSSPIKFILDKKITIDNYFEYLKDDRHSNKFSIYLSMGLDAIKNLNGYAPDGSRFDGKYLFSIEESHDVKFNQTLSEIKTGYNTFTYGDKKSFSRVEVLEEILSLLEKNKIEYYVFITPVAPTISKEFLSEVSNFGYIEELRQYVKINNYFDFHNVENIGTSDCEFLDGYHGGDVLYQRLILEMAKKKPTLDKWINSSLLQDLIIKFNGSNISNINGEVNSKYINDDVLELNCPKVHTRINN